MRRTLATLLLIPALATAQPGEVCKREHAAIRGRPAPCTGVLSPPQTALDGAECVDALLPRCEALRERERAVARAEAVELARQVSEADARAERWRALAVRPCPPSPVRVVYKQRGLPSWASWALAGAALVVGGAVGWRARDLVR